VVAEAELEAVGEAELEPEVGLEPEEEPDKCSETPRRCRG